MKVRLKIACLAIIGALVQTNTIAQENFLVHKQGTVHFAKETAAIDSVKIEENNTKINFYAGNVPVYSSHITEVDSITFMNKPVADLLDIVFKADGTAEDISPKKMPVSKQGSGANIYYNEAYKRYVAKFDNPYGGACSGYYKIDYTNNAGFKNALMDGHTLEAVFMTNYTGTIPDKESKPFSSHQAGGTGLLITTAARGNDITFLANVTSNNNSNWIWTESGVTPQSTTTYYHVVGVWNKDEQKTYVYVNGELKATAVAVGNFRFPATGSHWFCIGGDAGPTAGEFGWTGDVVLARAYDAPLTPKEVALLWNDVKISGTIPALVTDVTFLSGLKVKPNGLFRIYGKGFQDGDKIELIPVNENTGLTLNATLNDKGISLTLPAEINSGRYLIKLRRAEQKQDLGMTEITVVTTLPPAPEIIAHRGYWNASGSAQNSIKAIEKAQDLNLFGTETDVWITSDGVAVLNHDASLHGVNIENSTYEQVQNLTLSNGEKMPTLAQALEQIKKSDKTKLIIEIKTHSSSARNKAAAKACVDAVSAAGLENRVEYIAFSLEICEELVRLNPEAMVAYLNGNIPPQALFDKGIKGIDYHISVLRNNPLWITEAKTLGMTVNVWTVNGLSEIIEMTNAEVNYITTDNPVSGLMVREHYAE